MKAWLIFRTIKVSVFSFFPFQKVWNSYNFANKFITEYETNIIMAKRQEAPKDTSAFYMELSKLEKSEDFDKALKVCNKILNLTPKDDTAFHCKMVWKWIQWLTFWKKTAYQKCFSISSLSLKILLNFCFNPGPFFVH